MVAGGGAIDWRRYGGLEPRAWLVVGAGYSREELKSRLIAEGVGLTSRSVHSPIGLAQLVLTEAGLGFDRERVLGNFARREALAQFLKAAGMEEHCPELKRLKRSRTFFARLDRAMQSGRRAFAHPDEANALEGRLSERLGEKSVLREELRRLATAWESWLETSNLWDEIRIWREAIRALDEGISLPWPEAIHVVRIAAPEALEEAFWGRVRHHVPVEATTDSAMSGSAGARWERWHTLDDAADALARELAAPGALEGRKVAVLIPDQPAVRRTLVRALEQAGVPLADPRDPTRLRWDERIKRAMLPLELVALGYERESVVAWLSPKNARAVREIYARGIRDRLESYRGGELEPVYRALAKLDSKLGGRKRVEEISEAHLEWVRAEADRDSAMLPVLELLERLWTKLKEDLELIQDPEKKSKRGEPARIWLERLRERIQEGSPPVDYARPRFGVQLYRLSQAPTERFDRVEVLGLPPQWLEEDSEGDYWFSDREREVLAPEFAVRSGARAGEEREQVFRLWMAAGQELVLRDASYDFDGRERESLVPLLGLLGIGGEDPKPDERGAHPRWLPSFGPASRVQGQDFLLGPPRVLAQDPSGRPELRASEADLYSRCGMIALALGRWKLSDLRVPEPDLWANESGTVLHRALRLLLEARDETGRWLLSPEKALDQAWEDERPRGLLRGERLRAHARNRMLPLLRKFMAKEDEYRARAQTRVFGLEGPELRLDLGFASIKGTPDRVDEHADGFFVIDYKSGSKLAKGREMIDRGYRLQLPIYAMAAQAQFGKPAIGVQFVEINKRAGRSQGIFFKKWNGAKTPQALTTTTSNSKSLIGEDPSIAWGAIEAHLRGQVRDYLDGKFAPRPKVAEECKDCRQQDFCGFRRGAVLSDSDEGEGE